MPLLCLGIKKLQKLGLKLFKIVGSQEVINSTKQFDSDTGGNGKSWGWLWKRCNEVLDPQLSIVILNLQETLQWTHFMINLNMQQNYKQVMTFWQHSHNKMKHRQRPLALNKAEVISLRLEIIIHNPCCCSIKWSVQL